ncbi:hypothetical protein HNQ92_003390 [Rhabdobacter roseus]|uniref:DUF6970 domain-containing protein n=1 Tax=Rhabdobacter roseus TaxID=1655419 RepID=A0A840TVD8_9BACT|nr:hypothetical protein [Rhabdobacter roseus]MBB5285233.1 hypothetical protein [Rhabdobacter roseus]
MKKSILLILCAGFFLGCESEDIPRGTPSCIKDLINDVATPEGVWSSPAEVYRYQFKGKTVYYLRSHCCDAYDYLLDENCNVLCAPNGGFHGYGDGKCPDFFDLRKNEKLIWRDSRL